MGSVTTGDLRARQRKVTRDLILEAMQELVVEHHGWTVSMDQVAERAGVSRRTLYRYFPSKDDLLDAASRGWTDANIDDGTRSPRLEDLEGYLGQQWRELYANLPAVMAQSQSPSGRDMRRRFVPRARRMAVAEFSRVLEAEPDDIAGLDDLCDLMILIMSSSAFLELVDRVGRTPDDAARLAAWAAQAVIDRARRDGGMVHDDER